MRYKYRISRYKETDIDGNEDIYFRAEKSKWGIFWEPIALTIFNYDYGHYKGLKYIQELPNSDMAMDAIRQDKDWEERSNFRPKIERLGSVRAFVDEKF